MDFIQLSMEFLPVGRQEGRINNSEQLSDLPELCTSLNGNIA
jgi:hypothetical protein